MISVLFSSILGPFDHSGYALVGGRITETRA